MKRLDFFALKSDLLILLDAIESKVSMKYVLAETSSTAVTQEWTHGSEIPGLGRADGAQPSLCRSYLLTQCEIPIQPRRIQQFDGTTRFDVDQLLNPDSIVFTPAGEWKEEIILSGNVGTTSPSSVSQSLMKVTSGAMRRHFTKVRAFWGGPEALNRLRSGTRLTIAEQSPPIYNLQE